MDEARRFMRYVIPGLAAFLEVILILVLNEDYTVLKENADLGTAAIGFFASGIIGFLFSNLYYIIYWKIYLNKKSKIARLNYIALVTDNEVLFKDFNIKNLSSQKEAWTVLNTFFNLTHAEKFEYYEKRTDGLSNILACIGTTWVIILSGMLLGLPYVHELKEWYIILNITFIIILPINYHIAAGILQKLYVRIFEWLNKNPDIFKSHKPQKRFS